ncbi:hypothetical protein [Sneathia sanguinegens]|uniref:hypothetical protein n=1 Tax=Sneathia sanguinegens TaxID=40543 RepID=UPI002907BCFF|nr:hypothetical protein [Sneathia sanguinegens]MDU7497243.1 hypothetical protein [Sneathia sanguinegens]
MKNKISLFALLLTISSFSANKLPVNIDFDVNTGYSFEKVTKKEFDEVGLGNLVKGDLKIYKSTLGANLGVSKSFNTKYKKFKVEVGGGIGATLAFDTYNNFSQIRENDKEEESLIALEKKLDNLNFASVRSEEAFEKFSTEFSLAYKSVRDVEYRLLKEREELFKLNRQIKERTKYKEVYNDEKDRQDLKKMYVEIEKQLKEKVKERNKLNAELNEYINQHPEIAKEDLIKDKGYSEKLEKLREKIKETDHCFTVAVAISVDEHIVDKLDEDSSKYKEKKVESEKRIKELEAKREKVENAYKEKYGTYNKPEIVTKVEEKIQEEDENEGNEVPNLVKHFKKSDGTFDFTKNPPVVNDDESIRDDDDKKEDPSKVEVPTDKIHTGEEEGDRKKLPPTDSTEPKAQSVVKVADEVQELIKPTDDNNEGNSNESDNEEEHKSEDENNNEEDNDENKKEASEEEDTFEFLTEDDIDIEKTKWETATENYDELKKEYEEKRKKIGSNAKAIDELAMAIATNKLSYEFSTYASTKFEYKFNDEVEIVLGLDLGLSIANNRIYSYAKYLQDVNAVVDKKQYLIQNNLKHVKVNPLFKFNVVGRYKNFNLGVYGMQTNNTTLGFTVGYRFK